MPDAFLLTWNPDKFDWVDYPDMVAQNALGHSLTIDWSVGNRSGGISPGDTVYMLRQGSRGRGIIASGVVASGVEPDRHWDGSPGEANYIDVHLDHLVGTDRMLPTELLNERFPEQWWRPQMSGNRVKPEIAPGLAALWREHLGISGAGAQSSSTGSEGQGVVLDAVQRKKIEDAAQERLMAHFRERGWSVEDTRLNKPYDAVAQRGSRTYYLEAKGTQTAGDTVRVTRGEVEHAQANPGHCAIGVWSEMEFGSDGEIDLSAGRFAVFSFAPLDRDLEAIAFNWRHGEALN